MTGSRDEMTPYGPLGSGAKTGPVPCAYWVVAHSLSAGAHPPAGPDGIEGLIRAGVDVIVSLTDIDSGIRRHPNVEVRPHPIADFSVPSVAEMAGILDTIDDALDVGRAVYVHCLAGVGRTGTVVGCWLIRHRVCRPGGATDLIARLRSHAGLGSARSPETDQQAEFVESWLPGH